MPTLKPLTISVHPDLVLEPWVTQLSIDGHIVICPATPGNNLPASYVWNSDLILGPNCAMFLPGMEAYLPSFLAGARKIKYPKKVK